MILVGIGHQALAGGTSRRTSREWFTLDVMRWLKQRIGNKPLIMGRKTFCEVYPQLLYWHGPINVVTENPHRLMVKENVFHHLDVERCLRSLDTPHHLAQEVFVLGGVGLLHELMPRFGLFYLFTHANAKAHGQAFNVDEFEQHQAVARLTEDLFVSSHRH